MFHGLPDLFPGRGPVHVVHLVQVDMVGLQPAQAGLAGAADVVRRQTTIIRARPHRLVHLGRQYQAVTLATALQPAPDDLFREAEALRHVDAGVHGSIHDGKAGRLIGKLAEVHGAKAQPADLQARAAQRGIVHGELLQE
ncbi:hypothetical protein G6F32_014469 [Rhizopus arrhizus]|nr:hypothetical protein G6F32_014469 [Rhizopus arrhizus]